MDSFWSFELEKDFNTWKVGFCFGNGYFHLLRFYDEFQIEFLLE